MEKLKTPIMVTKSFLPPFEEFMKEAEKIWRTHWLTNMGPMHEEFKEELKNYLKAPNITLTTNNGENFGYNAGTRIWKSM